VKIMKNSKSKKALLTIAIFLLLGTMACVRTLTPPEAGADEKSIATDAAAETKDAAVQLTLGALLGTATNEVSVAAPSATSEPTVVSPTDTPNADSTLEATSAETSEATAAETASATSTEAAISASSTCYVHRYVYDETYPDGTRVDPAESFEKIWRLQNVGTCDWVNGKYQMAFVSGDQMGGASTTVITFTVPADGYANFSVDLTAPTTPGTYRGNWILQTTDGDDIGWGPDADQTFWVEITVRGSTATP
jgi:hypothetical protein